jgi:hypothetical protein
MRNRIIDSCFAANGNGIKAMIELLIGGLDHFFPFSWECHHPN